MVALLAAGSLAACGLSGPRDPAGADPYAPFGSTGDTAVDGLTVGHRLMQSGEYELARKAYLRAAGEQGATADVLSALGSANLRLGRLGQAEDLLRRAIKVDASFVPAWNNLGVALMERGKNGEAKEVFRTAYALDSGQTDSIRENLRLAIAKTDDPAYAEDNDNTFSLVRRGRGEYLLLSSP